MVVHSHGSGELDATMDATDVDVLSPDEARMVFDTITRRRMGMNGEEFLRRWDADEFREGDDHPGLMEVVMVLPLVGR